MSDSVDRVFSHALNTVNKIRTGSQKPPSTTRLRLYGLYKQAMEGDVDGIMERPQGNGEEQQRAREKWDAWKQQNGLSRTEAKRRYITTLINTMHQYASPSPDSRELVAELEFVWDQVKSNVPSSQSSSPRQEMGQHIPSGYSQMGQSRRAAMEEGRPQDSDDSDKPLRVRSPMSESEEALEQEEADLEAAEEEFVDAPDSQYQPDLSDAGVQTDLANLMRRDQPPQFTTRRVEPNTPTPAPRMRSIIPQPIPIFNFSSPSPAKKDAPKPQHETAADAKWRARIEASLMKLTAEVAALREQLEARQLFSHSPHYRLLRGLWRWVCAGVKHVLVDLSVLAVFLIWLRWKGDRRLEGILRGLIRGLAGRLRRMKLLGAKKT